MTTTCGNTPSRQTEPHHAASGSSSGATVRGNVMNDRQWEIYAYAAFAFVFVSAILAATMIADRLA